MTRKVGCRLLLFGPSTRSMFLRNLLRAFVVLPLACFSPWSPLALADAPIVVGNGTPASCNEVTLRHALIAAGGSRSGTVRFNCGKNPIAITLTETTLTPAGNVVLALPDNTTIDGEGSITLAGGASAWFIFVAPATTATLKNISITHRSLFTNVLNAGILTVEKSRVFDSFGGGILNQGTLIVERSTFSNNGGFGIGGIGNRGDLTLKNSVLSDNFGFDGGGIANTGTGTITNTTFVHNVAEGTGGIHNRGTLTIDNSTFDDNHGIFGDGGITNHGTLTVKNSMFSANLTHFGGAGGIGNGGALSVKHSVFSSNTAGVGGGIAHYRGTLTVENSEISGNRAFAYGGGLAVLAGEVTISNSRIMGNTAVYGGGIYKDLCCGATLTLQHTTVTGNTPTNIAP